MELSSSSSSSSSSRPIRPTTVNGGDRNHLNGGPPPPQKHQQQPNGRHQNDPRQQNHHYTIDQNQCLPESHHRQQNIPDNHRPAESYYHRQNHPENPHRHDGGYYRRSSSSSASVKGCCCCLFLLFSFIILLILAVVLTVILAVKPKKPQFDLQQVGVQYMGITAPDPNPADTSSSSSASLSLTIRMLFTAVNPNKVGIKYRDSRFTVMYRGIPLGRATVPGFYQDAHSVRNVDAIIAVERVNLLQANAADLIRDASLNDRIELTVFGDVGAKIRVMNIDSPGVQVSLNCFIVISPRKQALTSKQCGFDGLSV